MAELPPSPSTAGHGLVTVPALQPAQTTTTTVWLGCECCCQVSAWQPQLEVQPCPRCQHPLRARKPLSLQRTWAYLISAALAYVPANLMPIMSTVQAFRTHEHTLMGGIAELWHDHAYGLAVIVFIASIAVPLMKIGALALLAWTVQYAPDWRRLERARVFGMIEAVGHWSMLDVYVVVLLVAMVRFGGVASAEAGPGLLAFSAVVVLTMLAAHSFDPRMIWPPPGAGSPTPAAPAALPPQGGDAAGPAEPVPGRPLGWAAEDQR